VGRKERQSCRRRGGRARTHAASHPAEGPFFSLELELAFYSLRPFQVDTTGVSEMSNPIRFGQEFQGRIANPRDVLVFHRSKKASKTSKVAIDQPELSIDDPNLSISEKLSKVRVQTLVKEYLAAQELQLLGETGMSDAIQMFVEKDDTHAIQSYVFS